MTEGPRGLACAMIPQQRLDENTCFLITSSSVERKGKITVPRSDSLRLELELRSSYLCNAVAIYTT
jgi:hypothetical protein